MFDIFVFIPLNILLTVFLMPFKIGVKNETIAFHIVVIKSFTLVKTVEIVVKIAVHIVLYMLKMVVRIGSKKPYMAFHISTILS